MVLGAIRTSSATATPRGFDRRFGIELVAWWMGDWLREVAKSYYLGVERDSTPKKTPEPGKKR